MEAPTKWKLTGRSPPRQMLPSASSLDENLKLNENINAPSVGQLSFRLILNVRKEKLCKNEMKNNQKQWETLRLNLTWVPQREVSCLWREIYLFIISSNNEARLKKANNVEKKITNLEKVLLLKKETKALRIQLRKKKN